MRGLGILGNLGILGILESIIGDVIFVPNAENVENSLPGICFLPRMKTNGERHYRHDGNG